MDMRPGKLTSPAHAAWSGGRHTRVGTPLSEERELALLHHAWLAGVRTFVTADVLGAGAADAALGRALAGRARADYCLVGAVGQDFYCGRQDGPRGWPRFTHPGLRPPNQFADYLRRATELALARCRTDHFDWLLLHNPDWLGFSADAVWGAMDRLREVGLTRAIGIAPGPANGYPLDLLVCFQRFGPLLDAVMLPLNWLERWPAGLVLPAAAQLELAVITRGVEAGGLLHDGLGAGANLSADDPRQARPAGWIEAGLAQIAPFREVAQRRQCTLLQLACLWNQAQPGVRCVAPTLIQEAGAGARPPEAQLDELAALPAAPLTSDELGHLAEVAPPPGRRNWPGADRAHLGEPEPDRWALGADHEAAARHWGIDLAAWFVWLLLAGLVALLAPGAGAAAELPAMGLRATFTSKAAGATAATDTVATPNLWLWVGAGAAPTPFLPAAPFATRWEAELRTEIAGEYQLQAELNGELAVMVDEVEVLKVQGGGGANLTGPKFKLSAGGHRFSARFQSPAAGNARVRLEWRAPESFFQPVPSNVWRLPAADEAALRAEQRQLGRGWFLAYRCAKCHLAGADEMSLPEAAMDAPDLAATAAGRHTDWLTRWLTNPAQVRPGARMPRLVPDEAAAAAITAYLRTLRPSAPPAGAAGPDAAAGTAGRKLFVTLHCDACHAPLESAPKTGDLVPLTDLAQKFLPGRLTDYLRQPAAHYTWTRMPDFRLSELEAGQLAAYLAPVSKPSAVAAGEAAQVEQGKKLVQASGCLNCHALNLPNSSAAPKLAALRGRAWDRGCLAESDAAAGRAPRFALTAAQLAALREFGTTDLASLSRPVPAEFAERQTRELNCRGCHGRFEGFPKLDGLGGKLRGDWSAAFIGGQVTNTPRPWLTARMPAFASRAAGLAEGLAAGHGYAFEAPPEALREPDPAAAEIGRKLVSLAGGFSCVSCHAVGEVKAAQTSETAGINLALVTSRLRRPYFFRWVRNPQLVDPSTKMPVYFDEEGRSPLTEILDGDGPRQLEAIWQYLRLGDRMPPPPTP